MSAYLLTKEAENDIRHIIRYTRKKWGDKQVEAYRSELKQKLKEIGSDTLIPKLYSKNVPDVYFCRIKAHFIFYMVRNSNSPIIIAVLHTSQDIMKHLSKR
jgi:plasmid stabilization system protein ParE